MLPSTPNESNELAIDFNSLLEARIILSKECADTLAAERDSLVDKRRNRLLCVMGAPAVGALEEINNILHQSNPPLGSVKQ